MTLDMTRGNPAKLILAFSLPLFLGNLFQQLYNMADTFIVGRTLGANALAAVGATGSISFFILGFAQGLAQGFSIVTAQRFGAKNEEGVRASFGCSLVLCIVGTLVLTPLSAWGARALLQVLRTPADIIDNAHAYIFVILLGLGASLMFNLLASALRAVGDSRTPLYFLILASLVNIVLDYVLITQFHMGVAGAAVATIVAQLLSGTLCVVYMLRKFPQLHIGLRHLKPSITEITTHLRIGLPMAFQNSIIAIGALILQIAINGLGSDAVAGFTTGSRIEGIFTLPLASLGVTMATFCAQNYGAGDYKRVVRGLRQCLAICMVYSVAAGAVSVLLGGKLAALFLPSQPDVVQLAHTFLSIVGAGYWMLGILFICRSGLQGLGKSAVPTVAGFLELVMRSGAAILLTAPLGFVGVCLAEPLAWCASAVTTGASIYLVTKQLSLRQTMATQD